MFTEQELYEMEPFDILNILSMRAMLEVFRKLDININKELRMAIGRKERCNQCVDNDACTDEKKATFDLDVIKKYFAPFAIGTVKIFAINAILDENRKNESGCAICKSIE